MKLIKFVKNGIKYRVKSTLIGHELWLHINGETHVIDLRPKKSDSSASSGRQGGGAVLAPMPGKVLKVNYSLDSKVEANKAIIVLEAMKMEYSLSVPFSGRLAEVNCREGQQVELNQKLALVVVEEETNERKS